MLSQLLVVLGFLRFVLRRWTEDRCPEIAGSLTYNTLLALVPVFAIAVALLSSMPFFEDVMVQFKVFLLLNLVPEIAGRIITVYMEEFAGNAGRLTTVGVAFLVVTAVTLMFAVDRSLNSIWRVQRHRPVWMSIAGYLAMLSTGPLLIGVSVSVTTYLMSLTVGRSVPPGTEPVTLAAVPTLVNSLAFFLLYRIVPNRSVPWRHAVVGGLAAGVLFEGAKQLFAVYVRYAPAQSVVYGTFAALPIFLLWVYLSWLVVLFGAELTACMDYWRSRLWQRLPTHHTRFGDAVAVARRLFEARGAPVPFERLRLETGMPMDQLEEALHHMAESGLVVRVGRTGFAIPVPQEDAEPAPLPPRRLRKGRRGKARSAPTSR